MTLRWLLKGAVNCLQEELLCFVFTQQNRVLHNIFAACSTAGRNTLTNAACCLKSTQGERATSGAYIMTGPILLRVTAKSQPIFCNDNSGWLRYLCTSPRKAIVTEVSSDVIFV